MAKVTGKKINELLRLNAKHSLYREDGKWYHQLKLFPGILFDANGYIIFQTRKEYTKHSKLKIRQDVNIIDGIESIEGYKKYSKFQKEILNFPVSEKIILADYKGIVSRKLRQINSIIRNQGPVKHLKKCHNHKCQICKIQIEITKGIFYSEIHHIRPLGKHHNGSDSADNMICVCPNCHVKLDLGIIPLDLKLLTTSEKHRINVDNINYHNKKIFEKYLRKNK